MTECALYLGFLTVINYSSVLVWPEFNCTVSVLRVNLHKSWNALIAADLTKTLLFQIELLDTVALNLHRIDKDVQRCDRNYWYFTADNLEKLRNVMCRYDSWGRELLSTALAQSTL